MISQWQARSVLGDNCANAFAQCNDDRIDLEEQIAVGLSAAANRLIERLAPRLVQRA